LRFLYRAFGVEHVLDQCATRVQGSRDGTDVPTDSKEALGRLALTSLWLMDLEPQSFRALMC
jgi:hypothetical protein